MKHNPFLQDGESTDERSKFDEKDVAQFTRILDKTRLDCAEAELDGLRCQKYVMDRILYLEQQIERLKRATQ